MINGLTNEKKVIFFLILYFLIIILYISYFFWFEINLNNKTNLTIKSYNNDDMEQGYTSIILDIKKPIKDIEVVVYTYKKENIDKVRKSVSLLEQ